MARPADWKKARGLNDNPLLVAVPGMYEITGLDTAGKKLLFGNFTKSLRIKATGGAFYIGLTEAGMDGSNRDHATDGQVYQVDMQVPSIFVRAASGTVTLNITVVLTDIPVPAEFGDLETANGFEGGNTSTAIEDLS